MTVELKMLACSIVLGIFSVLFAGALTTGERGVLWNLGNRDGEAKSLSGAASRAARANLNFLETFPFFAAAVLAVVLASRNNHSTALGAQLYFWGRLVYIPVYTIGIPYLRTLIWAVTFVGLLMIVGALF